MPEITIEVVSLDSAPVPALSCQFAGLGGTIGRDNGNTLVLRDPHRRVSRLHASVTFPKGLAVITNTSTSLPVTVGTTMLANGQKLPICADDMIEIGPFVLRVLPQQSNQVGDSPLAANESGELAIAEPLSNPPFPPFSAPDEKDPLADLFSDVSSVAKELASKDSTAANLVIPRSTPLFDGMAEIRAAHQPQPQRAFIPNASPSVGASSHANLDLDLVASGGGAGVDALTAAFLQGAGLAVSALPRGITPEVMAVIGRLLRSATAGVIDMLAARAATKSELQASVTLIPAQSDNPLTFLPNAESAMQQMLGQCRPGMMRADEAMQSAFDDLRAHEIGVNAGIRAALTEVLDRFDPFVLEKRLADESLFESLLPAMRKKKLWDSFLDQYLAIKREAEDDVHAGFGHSFLAAYEQEYAHAKTHKAQSGK